MNRHTCLLWLASGWIALVAVGCRPDVRVVELQGKVTQGSTILAVGDLVAPTPDVEVVRGRAVFDIEGYGTIRLFAKTRFQVHARYGAASLKLAVGKVWSVIDRSLGKKRYEVETPNAIAGVRGTEFVVDVRDDETSVGVIHGEVEVSSRQTPSERTTLRASQQSAVRGQSSPSAVRPYDSSHDANAWRRLGSLFDVVKERLKQAADAAAEDAKKAGPEVKSKVRDGASRLKKGLNKLFDE